MCLAKILYVSFVLSAEPLGDEAIERLPDRILGRKKKHSLGRGIKEDDPVFIINGDDSVHCRANYAGQLLLASTQRLLGLLALGNVSDGDESQRPAVRFLYDGAAVTEYRVPVNIGTPHVNIVVDQVFTGDYARQRPLFELQNRAIKCG